MKGYLFHKGRLKVVVSKVFTPNSPNPQPYTSSHFVEISCVVPSAGGQVNKFLAFFRFQFA